MKNEENPYSWEENGIIVTEDDVRYENIIVAMMDSYYPDEGEVISRSAKED